MAAHLELPQTAARSKREVEFEALVRRHQSMVYSLAWHSLQDQSLAEDVAQDVFILLYRCFHSFHSEEHLKNWLRKVTLRRCIGHTRRSRNNLPMDSTNLSELPAGTGTQDCLLQARLRRLVASLPPAFREVLILRYQEDLDCPQIASILGIPERTVRSRLRRALELLREKVASANPRRRA